MFFVTLRDKRPDVVKWVVVEPNGKSHDGETISHPRHMLYQMVSGIIGFDAVSLRDGGIERGVFVDPGADRPRLGERRHEQKIVHSVQKLLEVIEIGVVRFSIRFQIGHVNGFTASRGHASNKLIGIDIYMLKAQLKIFCHVIVTSFRCVYHVVTL